MKFPTILAHIVHCEGCIEPMDRDDVECEACGRPVDPV